MQLIAAAGRRASLPHGVSIHPALRKPTALNHFATGSSGGTSSGFFSPEPSLGFVSSGGEKALACMAESCSVIFATAAFVSATLSVAAAPGEEEAPSPRCQATRRGQESFDTFPGTRCARAPWCHASNEHTSEPAANRQPLQEER